MTQTAEDRARTAHFTEMVRPYWGANTRRSLVQLLTSALPFFALWYAMLRSLEVGYWLTLLLAVPAAAFLMRLFMIQHDCGHGSFFRARAANDWVGRVIGVLTLTPYDVYVSGTSTITNTLNATQTAAATGFQANPGPGGTGVRYNGSLVIVTGGTPGAWNVLWD